MNTRENVYILKKIMDDPRYEGFAAKDAPMLTAGLPKARKGQLQKKPRMAPTWKPVEVVGRVRKFNDFPGVGLMPAFSQKAVDALRDFLQPNGELLPLKTNLGSYYAYNVTTVVGAFDARRSKVHLWIGLSALLIDRYELLPKKIEGHSIFHIARTGSDVYVTEPFVQRVKEHGLQGFWFKKIWPLPPGVDWRVLARKQSDMLESQGLPPDQTPKGNAVVIRLMLATAKPAAAERKAVEKIMDELDALLVDVDATAPDIGSLEGHDYGVPGECRLFLSCPDADALVKKLRPWLRQLQWPGDVHVLKRYGNYRDAAAGEEPVPLP